MAENRNTPNRDFQMDQENQKNINKGQQQVSDDKRSSQDQDLSQQEGRQAGQSTPGQGSQSV